MTHATYKKTRQQQQQQHNNNNINNDKKHRQQQQWQEQQQQNIKKQIFCVKSWTSSKESLAWKQNFRLVFIKLCFFVVQAFAKHYVVQHSQLNMKLQSH